MTPLANFVNWCSANDVYLHPGISFETRDDQYCAVAKDKLPSDDVIRVPDSLLITTQLAAGLWTDSMESLHFLLAKLKFDSVATIIGGVNISEKFAPYIAVLPSASASPLLWAEQDQALLKGTDAHILLQRRLQQCRAEYDAFLLRFGVSGEWASYKNYLWAVSIVSSRAFPSILLGTPNKAFMLPVVDMLNHKNGAKVKWDHNGGVTFKPLDVVASGSELFNNYGDKSNVELLLGYGFVLNDNEFDSTTISLRIPQESLDEAKAFGVELPQDASAQGINFTITKKDPLPQSLTQLFAFLCKLSSESGFTTRNTLEGLSQLHDIVQGKINMLKQGLGQHAAMPKVAQAVKMYRSTQRQLFQTCMDTMVKTEKKLLQENATPFKWYFKQDQQFANSLLLTFGITSFDDLKTLSQQHVLLLWLVKAFNDGTPTFIKTAFDNVAANIAITKEDVLEYNPMHKALIPGLSAKITEVYGKGDWSVKTFIIAGTVEDRVCFTRKSNNELYIIG